MSKQIDLSADVHDLLLSYQRDDEDLSDTLDRVFQAIVPHGINFKEEGIDPETLDDETRFVVERWPDTDGYVGQWVYDSKTAYLRAHGTLMADGGTTVDSSESDYQVHDFQPEAASRYEGDHECQYDCEGTADWLIESKASGYTGGRVFFCCQSCSRDNLIYARENELYRAELSEDAAEAIPESELEYVADFAEGDS